MADVIDNDVRQLVSDIMYAFHFQDGTWEGDSFRQFAEPRIQTLVKNRSEHDTCIVSQIRKVLGQKGCS